MKRATILSLALCVSLPLITASLTGCRDPGAPDTAPGRTEGQEADDEKLASRVKDALRESAEFKFDEVKVAAYRGTVQLSGFVNSPDQKRAAGEIAKRVAGVREVENNVTVK